MPAKVKPDKNGKFSKTNNHYGLFSIRYPRHQEAELCPCNNRKIFVGEIDTTRVQ